MQVKLICKNGFKAYVFYEQGKMVGMYGTRIGIKKETAQEILDSLRK